MFGDCCGCPKKKRLKLEVPAEEERQEAEAVPEPQVISTVSRCVGTEDAAYIVVEQPQQQQCVLSPVNLVVVQEAVEVVEEVADDAMEEENGDDDVFSDKPGPPARLAANLGTPYSFSKRNDDPENLSRVVDLPQWFLDEDQDEIGGIQEPPATPVGRDELALKRHRFFSQLMVATQDVSEHRVRFNPLGPFVADADQHDCCHNTFGDLEALISRLEIITDRLENICPRIEHSEPKLSSKQEEDSETKPPTMSVLGFQDILQGPFASYLVYSQQIGGDVATHSVLVEKAFQAQLAYLKIASESRAPANQAEEIALLQPTSQSIGAIQDFREKNRTSQYFNHLSAISESIPALGWVTISPAPSPYVKEMNDAGQFYTNRVLKDWKEKNKTHVDWVRSWVQTLSELQAYVKQHHTTGLVWSGSGAPKLAGGACPPPPPPACPPPPVLSDMADLDLGANDRSALFAQINQGENITRGLKKVTADMQTHKNTTLRTGPAPFKAPANQVTVGGLSAHAPAGDKPPVFTRDGKKWMIEYQKGNHNLLVDNTEMNNVIYLYKCADSTVSVKGKVNSIVLDSCKKTSIVFDSVVSSVEFINCQSAQMQVLGVVPTISIDKTDGCQMYLSPDSLNVEVISSKSSEMNVLVPKGNGDYTELPVPEQYKTTVNKSGLTTVAIESKG